MKQDSNPIFGLGIVKDKKRDQCHGFHSVTPGWRSKKGDRSLQCSSHLVRGDREGGGDKKSRCSLYSTVQSHPFPESFQPLFDGLVFGVAATSFFCKEAKKGAGAPLPHPYKFSFGPVLEVVLSGSCIFANGWLAKGLSGALASGAFWVWRQMGGEKTAFWQTHCLQAVISLATLIIIETAQSSSLLKQKR